MAIRSAWFEPHSAPSLDFADCIQLLHLWLQRIQPVWFWYWPFVMSMCRVFSCVVGRVCLIWPVCSLGKTLLAFALLHSILQGQICLSSFLIPVEVFSSSTTSWRDICLWISALSQRKCKMLQPVCLKSFSCLKRHKPSKNSNCSVQFCQVNCFGYFKCKELEHTP